MDSVNAPKSTARNSPANTKLEYYPTEAVMRMKELHYLLWVQLKDEDTLFAFLARFKPDLPTLAVREKCPT